METPRDGYVNALWVGPYGYRKAPEGTVLETGITVCEMPAGEAHASDDWQVLADDAPPPAPEPTPDPSQVS